MTTTEVRISPSGPVATIIGGVSSVFGRTGAVVAALGDYLASLVTNDSSATGATVKDGLNSLLGGQIATQVDEGNTGAAKALHLADGNNLKLTVDQNTTITVTAPADPGSGTLLVHMNATNFTVTWAGVRLAGGIQPVPSATGDDRYMWVYDGVTVDLVPMGFAFS